MTAVPSGQRFPKQIDKEPERHPFLEANDKLDRHRLAGGEHVPLRLQRHGGPHALRPLVRIEQQVVAGDSVTVKKGKRRGVSLVLVNVAVMVNCPAGPSLTAVGSKACPAGSSVTKSLTRGKNSKAPMSHAAVPSPLPSTTRGLPRWSVRRGSPLASGQSGPPASMAGLPGTRAWVWVGPPFKASVGLRMSASWTPAGVRYPWRQG